MQLSICGSYADATDRAVFSAAVNKNNDAEIPRDNILPGRHLNQEYINSHSNKKKQSIEYFVRGHPIGTPQQDPFDLHELFFDYLYS